MTSRTSQIDEFLATTPWQTAQRQPLNQDASFRRYWRLELNGKTAMLMDAPPPEKPVSLFADIAVFLRNHGLYAPTIYNMDNQHGLMLIEDFGDATFTRILKSDPLQENALYDLAIDTLIKLHRIEDSKGLSLAAYDTPTLIAEAQLFTEWFYPAVSGKAASRQQKELFAAAWRESFAKLQPQPQVLVLRDYHVDNLMRLEQADQSMRCGLLDFQDALMGSPAYDLMSLIEDARRDISDQLKNRCLQRYFSAMAMTREYGLVAQKDLVSWLNVLAAQRHAKVLGIFVRLYKRDGKANYLEHLPRVLALYTAVLKRETALEPVIQWMVQNLPFEDINLNTL